MALGGHERRHLSQNSTRAPFCPGVLLFIPPSLGHGPWPSNHDVRRPQAIPFPRLRTQMAGPLGFGKNFPHRRPWRRGLRSGQAEILCPRHVSLPKWRGTSCRPPGGLHRHRHHRSLQADERLQCAAPDGLRFVRPARRAVRDQDRPASGRYHRRQHRELPPSTQVARLCL